jgi:hypothetical protein
MTATQTAAESHTRAACTDGIAYGNDDDCGTCDQSGYVRCPDWSPKKAAPGRCSNTDRRPRSPTPLRRADDLMLTIPRPAARQSPRRPLTLTHRQRTAVRLELASRIGDGRAATRDQIASELFDSPAAPAPALACGDADVTPDTRPDQELTVAEAAARLGLRVQSVRRYLAPSSGKLARLGGGVSLASVQRFEASRS